MSARIWSGAAVASVLLHGAGLGAIALSTEPQDVPDQPIPESQFSIEAAQVPRSRAAPETPKGDAAAQTQAPATAAQSGAIPHSRAQAATPQSVALDAAPSPAQTLRADDASGTMAQATTAGTATLTALAAPTDAQSLSAQAPKSTVTQATTASAATLTALAALTDAQSLSAQAPKSTAAQATTASAALLTALATPSDAQPISAQSANAPVTPATAGMATAVTAATAPVATKVTAGKAPPTIVATASPLLTVVSQPVTAPAQRQSARAPDTQATPSETPKGQPTPSAILTALPAPSARPEAVQSDALPLPAIAGKAALAWSGDENTSVSATSLAAIAAFTQAGDIGAASAQVRDGIAGILASVPCARLQTTFLADTGQLELRGHIPDEGLRGPVLAALKEQIGDAITLSDQLLILPRPQCGALSGIAAVGLPQSTEQLSDPAVIGEDGFARNYTYLNGERLRLDLTAPDYDSYVYVDYFVADGSVIHLQPNEIVPLEFAPAKSAQSVGRNRDGKPFLELTVSPPFGQEIAAAFAASVPLYDGTRPIQEPAETYLAFLKDRVAQARAKHPDFKGEWVYFFISTKTD